MLLFSICQPKQLNYVVLVFVFYIIGCVKTETKNETSNVVQQAAEETPAIVVEQKSVKKELKVDLADEDIVVITPLPETEDHSEKIVIIDKEAVTESSGKAVEQQSLPKDSGKSDAKPITLTAQHHLYHEDEDFVINDENDITETLKTGFYFFLILSSAAVAFIIFKIYRLRLSRAERKYGVQGDRSMQELTPLPISLEDGPSDDEDQTVFEIQRQNIRIL